jgi:hypothetical protein
MEAAPETKVEEIMPRHKPAVTGGKEAEDAFGLARAAESFRHGIVDTTRIREQEKTLRETNTHRQKMMELEHAEAERKRTFRSNWIIAGAFCFFQLLIAAYGFKSNNVTYVLTAANGFAGFFVSRKF